MRDLNLPLDVFKEHIIGLQMCGEDHLFADIPVQAKKCFTVTYNKLNKCSIVATKKKKAPSTDKNLFSGAVFDPDFMENPSDDCDTSDESDQESEVVATNNKGAAKGGAKRAAPKGKTTKVKKDETSEAPAARGRGTSGRTRQAARGGRK